MKIRVTGESETPTRINLKSGNFSMIIDEPEQMGGTNNGPSPGQALLFALAGCLHITGNFVAKQMEIPLKSLNIFIDGSMNPSKFMGMNTDERAGFKSIDVNLKPIFENDVDDEKIKEWIAETERRCPVTDNIQAATHININF